jgi:hypothetical protein
MGLDVDPALCAGYDENVLDALLFGLVNITQDLNQYHTEPEGSV